MNILYILNRFPKISETFILNEIVGLINLGHKVRIVSLLKPLEKKFHKEIRDYNLIKLTHYLKYRPGHYSRLKTFEKGIKKFFECKFLTKEQKAQLIYLCYEKKQGKEVAFRKFLDVLNIIKIIRKEKIKHIHNHFAGPNVDYAYVLNKVIGIPYTFTTHAYDIFSEVQKDMKKWANNAKKVIAVSKFNKKYMNKKLGIPLNKIQIITYSKYLDKLKPLKKHRRSPFKIISISRLAEKKGYPYLIEACKILKDKKIEFSCEIQGEGPERKKLEMLIKKYRLKNKVKLGEALTHEEVIEFMKTGSVFVLPCIRAKNGDMDGIPNVLMESMALEIPTISTDVTGIPELIDNNINGIIVPQNNAESLAQAIIKIKNNPDFADKIRKKGRKKVMEKFNVEKNVRKLVRVFE
jgi:glycosyltransferase involved in cell wall biosynthesis